MRKTDSIKSLCGDVGLAVAMLSAALTAVTTFVLLAHNVVAWRARRSFLSYRGEMICCAILLVGGIIVCASSVIMLLLTDKPNVQTSATEDEPLAEAIESDHGNDLIAVMDAIRNEPLEYRAFFDFNGHKLTEGTLLSPTLCNIPANGWHQVYQFAHTDLHNHPGTDEVSFSDKDLYNLIRLGIQRSIVVTHSFNYIMENPWYNRDDGPSAESVKQYVIDLWSKHWFTRVVFTRACSRYVSHCVAKKFGLKYRIEHARLWRLRNSMKQFFTVPRRIVATGIIAGTVIMTGLVVKPDTTIRTDSIIADIDARDLAVTDEDTDLDYCAEITELSNGWAVAASEKPAKSDCQVVSEADPGVCIFQPERPPMVDHID